MIKHEPYKIKSIRNINFYSMPERKAFLREVKYNTGLLPSSKVTFDMVNQGSSAMSQEQVAALFIGDEAYAGARNFITLTRAINAVFGKEHVCPVHNRYGGLKLLSSIFVSEGKIAAGNVPFPGNVVEYFGGTYENLKVDGENGCFRSINIEETARFFGENSEKIAFVYVDIQGGGFNPVSIENLTELKKCADEHGVKVVLDASCIAGLAYYHMKNDDNYKNRKVGDLIKEIAACGHTVIFDAGQDSMSNVGGFLATNDPADHEKHQNEVVVYEGLHTYGGMAGRTMEAVSVGVREMADDLNAEWISHQVDIFAERLTKAGVPLIRGLNGVYLKTGELLHDTPGCSANTLAASLYLISGVRVNLEGAVCKNQMLPVLIPRRAFMNSQLEQIADAIISLYQQREKITSLMPENDPEYHYEAVFDWLIPELEEYMFTCEPYIIHAIEHVGMKSRDERRQAIEEAGYNTFLLKSEDVTVDLLTDSGTCAMSVDQWLYYLDAMETPSTPDAYYELIQASRETYGYTYAIPTHQGRAAEHIMSQLFIKQGDYVPGNMYFTTTKLHQEMAGGVFVDVIVDEAHNTESEFQWKGNIDLSKLKNIYEKAESEGRKIAYVSYEFNVNMAGGQPVSMDNIKAVYAYCKERNIPVFFDATRCAENACFIQNKDPRYSDVPVADILLEMFSYGDGATISCKKDMLTNLSGSLLFKDNKDWYEKSLRLLQLFEGPYCSGGTSAGDMAAHAQGLSEMIDDAYINSRVEQIRYLGELLHDAGVPIIYPSGGHAIFLDARKFLEHLDQDLFPSQMLAAQIFIETGVRSMERGNVSKGRNPVTGKNFRPALELVRLTIPRRVYTREHMQRVAEGIIRLYENRKNIKGLRFTYEPEKLRFFQSRFEEITE